jgi:hypothetical protein
MTGEVTLDYGRYRRMVLAMFGRMVWVLQTIGLVLAVLSLWLLLLGDQLSSHVYPLVMSIVMMGYYDLVVVLGWRRLGALTSRPWRYRIDEAGIGIHTPQTDTEVRWDAVRKAQITRDFWVLRLTTSGTVPIPRGAFSAAEAEQIDTLVERTKASA